MQPNKINKQKNLPFYLLYQLTILGVCFSSPLTTMSCLRWQMSASPNWHVMFLGKEHSRPELTIILVFTHQWSDDIQSRCETEENVTQQTTLIIITDRKDMKQPKITNTFIYQEYLEWQTEDRDRVSYFASYSQACQNVGPTTRNCPVGVSKTMWVLRIVFSIFFLSVSCVR